MGIAPQKLQGIISYLHVVNGLHVLGNLIRVKAWPAAHFIDAAGALAAEPEIPVWINAPVAIIPQDDDGLVLNIDFLRENSILH